MRSDGAIRHKLKQVRFRYLKRKLEAGLKCRPENCAHNVGFDAGDDVVRVCAVQLDPIGRQGVVCDERFGGCARAAHCPTFTPARTKDQVRAEFYADLMRMTLPEIAYNYPDMAALLWVLSDDGVDTQTFDPHEFDFDMGQDAPPPVAAEPVAPPVAAEPAPASEGRVVEFPISVKPPSSWVDILLRRIWL